MFVHSDRENIYKEAASGVATVGQLRVRFFRAAGTCDDARVIDE